MSTVLRREIVTTAVVNYLVNRGGITLLPRLMHGAEVEIGDAVSVWVAVDRKAEAPALRQALQAAGRPAGEGAGRPPACGPCASKRRALPRRVLHVARRAASASDRFAQRLGSDCVDVLRRAAPKLAFPDVAAALVAWLEEVSSACD